MEHIGTPDAGGPSPLTPHSLALCMQPYLEGRMRPGVQSFHPLINNTGCRICLVAVRLRSEPVIFTVCIVGTNDFY